MKKSSLLLIALLAVADSTAQAAACERSLTTQTIETIASAAICPPSGANGCSKAHTAYRDLRASTIDRTLADLYEEIYYIARNYYKAKKNGWICYSGVEIGALAANFPRILSFDEVVTTKGKSAAVLTFEDFENRASDSIDGKKINLKVINKDAFMGKAIEALLLTGRILPFGDDPRLKGHAKLCDFRSTLNFVVKTKTQGQVQETLVCEMLPMAVSASK